MFLIGSIVVHDGWVELQQMRYVLAVAETLNFTRAAQRCHVAQSALSHQIRSVERELGVSLFARTSRRVELTPAGLAFLPAARSCLESAERAAADAVATTGEISGTVTLGLIPTVTAVDVPGSLRRFHQAHPAVRIVLRTGGSDDLMSDLGHGVIDIAVLGLAESVAPQDLEVLELGRERLVAVVPTGHRLADRGKLSLEELAAETFVDFPVGTPGRAQSDLAFQAAGVTREVVFEVMSTGFALSLVGHGLAITLLPRDCVVADPRWSIVPVSDGPTRVQYLAWNDFNPTPAARCLLAELKSSTATK